MINQRSVGRVVVLALGSAAASWLLRAQAAPDSANSGNGSAQERSGEMAVQEEVATFRVNVRLVLARVVVRDARGHAVGDLHKEDFELLDNGQPQVLTHFAAEHTEVPVATVSSAAAGASQPAGKPLAVPERYVAYLVDDLHLSFEDLSRVRAAAAHSVDKMAPTDRIAIFSTSGQTAVDFTDDRAKLHETLNGLHPRPMFGRETNPCPDISLYMADLIVNWEDRDATGLAVGDYLQCAPRPMANASEAAEATLNAKEVVKALAGNVLRTGQQESALALAVLKDAVRRISVMPGQRGLILVSPGFLTPALDYEYYDVIDRAVRAEVIVSTLDARGLYVPIFDDISRPAPTSPLRRDFDTRSADAQEMILAVLANSTGGTHFHNNNDMDEGFRRVADAPEFYYVLGFTPQSLKMDGKFHTLKVNLKVREKYDLQVRRGYYAPRHAEDVAEEAKREIEDEVFASEELHDLPLELRTQFFKTGDDAAKLTVLAHMDVKRLRYKKAEGRNQNEVTLVTAVFDRNGNYLQGNQRRLQMRWKDETLQSKLGSGITMKSSFDVKPGNYMVRVVVRDGEQQLMSAENGAVEIP